MTDTTTRRRFLQLSTFSAIAAAFGGSRALAEDAGALYLRTIPTRKTLDPRWLASLVERGHALDAGLRTQEGLPHIGMTVGGIGAGTVYLSGDGRLFVWDIFNKHHEGVVPNTCKTPASMPYAGEGKNVRERDGANYILPPSPETHPNAFPQEFAIRLGDTVVPLDSKSWKNVRFTGRWPLGTVEYRDPSRPVEVTLQAWTPFIPLHVEDSSFPATVVEIEIRNAGKQPLEVSAEALLGNPVLINSRKSRTATLVTRELGGNLPGAVHSAVPSTEDPSKHVRPDIVFEDFEHTGWNDWTPEGTAFGSGPLTKAEIPDYQGNLNLVGDRGANSHAAAPGEGIGPKDDATGTLTSPEFTLERRYLAARIGGGNQPGKTGLEVLVDGKVVGFLTGSDANAMKDASLDLKDHQGKKARIRIIDRATGPWGNTGVDQIVFTDRRKGEAGPLDQLPDYGTMALASPGEGKADVVIADENARVSRPFKLEPGATGRAVFLLSWHFPNTYPIPAIGRKTHYYASRFKDAEAVAREVSGRLPELRKATFDWVATWNDSTLPQWLLDRSILTANTLQTANCFRFEDGRFWAWEGVGACPGTCTHVWHYAQGIARLFPELERNLREVTDYKVSQNPEGAVFFRAESGGIAIDGQAGTILRTWREHRMSPDDAFLKRVWPGAKKAIEWLIRFDADGRDGLDGLLDGRQHNTLDADWYGKVHCLCSLYLAALRAGEEMAKAVGDTDFSQRCKELHAKGSEAIVKVLFRDEFFVQQEDPAHADAIGVGTGCYIDQVIGQWWAFETGLGRLYDAKSIRASLDALWKYNFVTEMGSFRKAFTQGRFYALPGEAGLLMCTWPKGGLREDFKKYWQYGYFNECMSGFEWQAAAHMIREGAPVTRAGGEIGNPNDPRAFTLRGLAIARAVHDRYAPAKRNPYNEIECSDHYARAAASYSTFLAVCGHDYHGPEGVLAFAPKLGSEDFRAPFTAAEGWGTFSQKKNGGAWTASIELRHGKLRLNELKLPWLKGGVKVRAAGREVAGVSRDGSVRFSEPLVLEAGERLEIG